MVRNRWTSRHHITTIDYVRVSGLVDFVPRVNSLICFARPFVTVWWFVRNIIHEQGADEPLSKLSAAVLEDIEYIVDPSVVGPLFVVYIFTSSR